MEETQTPSASESQAPQVSVPALAGPVTLAKQAWELYKSKFKLFTGILLAPVLLGVLSNILNPNYLDNTSWSAPWVLAQVLIGLLFMASMVLAQASLVVALRDRKENLEVEEAYKRGLILFWPYVWVTILNAFIIIGGFFFFIIPGIYFMFIFLFSVFVMATEGGRGMEALLKSREYVRGRWWAVVGRYLAVTILALIAFALVNGIAALISSDFAWVSLVSSVGSLVVVPFLISYFYLMYESLKSLKVEVSVPVKGFERWGYLTVAALGYLLVIVLLTLGIFFTVLGFFLGWLFGSGFFGSSDLLNNLPSNSI